MFVKLIFILCVSNCFGHLKGENFAYGNQLEEFKNIVYQKIEVMEHMINEKDERVDKLESVLVNQQTEITQLKQWIESLEQELLYKNAFVDRLQYRITDLELAVDTNQPKPKVGQHLRQRKDPTLKNGSLGKFRNPLNETISLRQSVRSLLSVSEIGESSIRQDNESFSQSGDEQSKKDKTKVVSRATIPRIQQKRVVPSSHTPSQRVAFHVALSRDKIYHEDNIVVYSLEKLDHGNGYNPGDGIYTAPEPGTYVFTWTSLCYGNQQFQTVIVVNGAYMGSSWTDAEVVNDVHQTTAVVILTLNQGDHVFIRMGSTYGHGNLLSRTTFGESTFSGWKLD